MPNVVPSGSPGPLAHLSRLAGPQYGEELPIPAPVVTLGRGAGCEVVIDDDSVSAQHARLEYDVGAWRITDLGSTNGTVVEGVRLAPDVPTPLEYGSTVRLGGVPLLFTAMEDVDLDAARADYVPEAPVRTLVQERAGFRLPLWLALMLLVIAVVLGILLYSFLSPLPTATPADAPAATTSFVLPPVSP